MLRYIEETSTVNYLPDDHNGTILKPSNVMSCSILRKTVII